MASLVWLITGCTSGFGAAFVRHLLSRSDEDKVIAASRNPSALQDKFPKSNRLALLQLDPSASESEVQQRATEALKLFGPVDIVINNAGNQLFSVIEDCTVDFLIKQLDVNLFGVLKVTRAFLPHFRERSSGIIVQIGSTSGFQAYPYVGLYAISKFALEALNDALSKEVAPFGIRTLMVNPGFFQTDLLQSNIDYYPETAIEAYKPIRDAIVEFMMHMTSQESLGGDVLKAVEVIVDIVKGEGVAQGRPMPHRIILGGDAVGGIEAKCQETLKEIEEWRAVSLSTGGTFTLPEGA